MPLAGRTITALRWRVGAQIVGKAAAWIAALFVVRILSPEEFGLVAAASVVVAIAELIGRFGLDASLVQAPRMGAQARQRIFGTTLLLNIALFALILAAAPAYADFLGFDGLAPVTRALSLQLLFNAVALVPAARLARAIEGKVLSVIDLTAAAVGAAVGLAAAVAGLGVWALVLGLLTRSALMAAGAVVAAGGIPLPSFAASGTADLRFGGRVLLTQLVNEFTRKADLLIVGRLLGANALGAYSVAVEVSRTPTAAILPAVQRVMFPFYARRRSAPEKAGAALVRSISVLSLATFPVFWGLAAIAPSVVPLVFGAKWAAAGTALQWLCLAMPLRAIDRLLPALARGFGREDIVLRNTLTALFCVVPCILAGSQWGLAGVAIGWSTGIALSALANLARTLPLVMVTPRQALKPIVPIVFAALAAHVAVQFSQLSRGTADNPTIWLAADILIGVIVYSGLIALLCRHHVSSALRILRPDGSARDIKEQPADRSRTSADAAPLE